MTHFPGKVGTRLQRACSLNADSFLDASDWIFSRQGLKAYPYACEKNARLHAEGEGQDNRWRGDGARHRGVARHRRIGAVIGGIDQSGWRRRGNCVLLRRQQELCSPPENYVDAGAPRLTVTNTEPSYKIEHSRRRVERYVRTQGPVVPDVPRSRMSCRAIQPAAAT
jgi:hypothetical protein